MKTTVTLLILLILSSPKSFSQEFPHITLEGHTRSVNSVSFSPDGRTLASGSSDDTVRLWNVRTGETQRILEGHTRNVNSVSFSPDGRTLASGGQDIGSPLTNIQLWDVGTSRLLRSIEASEDVYTLTFLPDGLTLASGLARGKITLWDTPTGSQKNELKGHRSHVVAQLALSPDGLTLASANRESSDGTILLWDSGYTPPQMPIYWIDRGTNSIRRLSTDGSSSEGIVTRGLKSLSGLALDAAGGKIYWTQGRTKKIQRADLDGSNVEDLVTQGLEQPKDITVAGSKMYWTDSGTDKIQRADLDGANVEDLVTRGLSTPNGLALDVVAGKMYWVDSGTDKIQRADLDGSNVEDLVTHGLEYPIDITVDMTGGKMYWTDVGTHKIQRADLDGSNVEDLVTELSAPHSIAIDAANGKMYWTDWRADKIQRADLDGSNVEDVVTNGIDSPSAIAIESSSGQPPVATPDPDDEKDDEETAYQAEDANRDGTVDVQDIVYIAQRFGQTGQGDVNGDGTIDVFDILLVAGALGAQVNNTSAAPAAIVQLPKDITAETVEQWLIEAELAGVSSPEYLRGMVVLERWLASLAPTETALLANYPNPFNPETWIPYHLADNTDVQISIYDINGTLVRQMDMGHQRAGYYTNRSRAAYWDGRNNIGERVGSGAYFYQLTADNYSLLRKMVILK